MCCAVCEPLDPAAASPDSVGAAAEAVIGVRGDARKLTRIFEQTDVPMVMVDGRRGQVEANRPARPAFRTGLEELRSGAIDELQPAQLIRAFEQAWERMVETGSVAGRYRVPGGDGSRVDIVYRGIAHVLPDVHLIAFAATDRPERELVAIEGDGQVPAPLLTRREIEVLALAADGLSGPALAGELALSPATIQTHFKNIYAKLEVRNRGAAVAKAMRLGLLD
jgi:DNA-binding CsgD family transcriptional regulator